MMRNAINLIRLYNIITVFYSLYIYPILFHSLLSFKEREKDVTRHPHNTVNGQSSRKKREPPEKKEKRRPELLAAVDWEYGQSVVCVCVEGVIVHRKENDGADEFMA
jgi:hypothetical protein